MFNLFEKTDADIERDVKDELNWDPRITSSKIIVAATDGIVTLRGNVPHYFEKSSAVEAAQRVGGVSAVADELEIDLMDSHNKSDEEIAKSVLFGLKLNYSSPKDLKVSVEKGVVRLKGEVGWAFERECATDTVTSLMGVKGVENQITIKQTVLPVDVKTRIERALTRSAESEGRKITVSVDGTQVTLSGNVHSFSEFGDAGLAAWNAPGVTTVENNLKIAQ